MTDITSATLRGKSSVERFLQFVFKGEWTRAHVAGVPGGGWGGGPWRTEHARIAPGNACYFSQSLFRGAQRTWADWEALWCVVLDDVGTKVNAGTAMSVLGMPAWRIESSPGNWQWGYLLTAPESDNSLCDLLFAELLKQGLCDPGAAKTGAIGYRRLPVGVNHKHPGHAVHGVVDPDAHTWTVREMLAALGLDDVAIANKRVAIANNQNLQSGSATLDNAAGVPVSPDTDPLYRLLVELGALSDKTSGDNEGYELVSCPWVHEHTGGIDTGHATYWPPGTAKGGRGFGAFHCFHGHCADRTVHDLRAWAEAQSGKTLAAEAFSAVDETEAAQIEQEAQEAKRPLDTAMDTAAKLAGVVYAEADMVAIFPSTDGTPDTMLKVEAFNLAYRDTLAPLLRRRPPPAEKPIDWLIRQPATVKVHTRQYWPGEKRIFRNGHIPVFNTWTPHRVGIGVPDDEAGMWVGLLRHLCTGRDDANDVYVWLRNWLAAILADDACKKPGWGVMLWSWVQGVGKDLVLLPVIKALGQNVDTVTVQRLVRNQFNPFANKRLVHGAEFNSLGRQSGISGVELYNLIKVHTDNSNDWVTINDKHMAFARGPNVSGWWLTSNREDAVMLDPTDRRLLVVRVASGRLPPGFYERYRTWLDDRGGVERVASYLRRVWQDMSAEDRRELYGPAPETSDKQDMADEADPILGLVREELPNMPDLICVQDKPLRGVVERVRQALGHRSEGSAARRVTHALTALGCRHASEYPVCWGAERRRLWVVRNFERYPRGDHAALARAYRAILDKVNEGAGENITALGRVRPNADVENLRETNDDV